MHTPDVVRKCFHYASHSEDVVLTSSVRDLCEQAERIEAHVEACKEAPLVIELRFVDVTHRGEYRRRGETDQRQVREMELMPVLVRVGDKGEDLAWYGPLWFADPDKNGKKRPVNHVDLTRMHWWSWEAKKDCPRASLNRDEVGMDEVWYYMTKGWNIARVPEIVDEFGERHALHAVPFG